MLLLICLVAGREQLALASLGPTDDVKSRCGCQAWAEGWWQAVGGEEVKAGR